MNNPQKPVALTLTQKELVIRCIALSIQEGPFWASGQTLRELLIAKALIWASYNNVGRFITRADIEEVLDTPLAVYLGATKQEDSNVSEVSINT